MEHEPSSKESSQETFRQEMLENLRHLKNDYKDEISDEIQHSTSADQKWKVRKGWFATLKFTLLRIRNKISLPTDLENKMIIFDQRRIGDKNKLTTQEDIDEAHRIIDEVIAELEK